MNQRTDLTLQHKMKPPFRPPAGKPPMLVMMHGVGSNEDDLFGMAKHLDPRFLIVSARGPLTMGPDEYGWYHVDLKPEGPQYDPAELDSSRLALTKFLEEAIEAYNPDPRQVYVMGFSQGAVMASALALTIPEKLAGAVVISGRYAPDLEEHIVSSEKLEGLSVLVLHGTADAVLPISHGHAIRDRFASLPVDLEYHEYAMGHEINRKALADLIGWLTDRINDRNAGY